MKKLVGKRSRMEKAVKEEDVLIRMYENEDEIDLMGELQKKLNLYMGEDLTRLKPPKIYAEKLGIFALIGMLSNGYIYIYIYIAFEKSGELVGYVVAEKGLIKEVSGLHILSIGVEEKYRRRQIASKLLASVVSRCEEMELNMVYLEVHTQNKAAIKLYEKHGFTKSTQILGYYRNTRMKPPKDAYRYIKSFKLDFTFVCLDNHISYNPKHIKHCPQPGCYKKGINSAISNLDD